MRILKICSAVILSNEDNFSYRRFKRNWRKQDTSKILEREHLDLWSNRSCSLSWSLCLAGELQFQLALRFCIDCIAGGKILSFCIQIDCSNSGPLCSITLRCCFVSTIELASTQKDQLQVADDYVVGRSCSRSHLVRIVLANWLSESNKLRIGYNNSQCGYCFLCHSCISDPDRLASNISKTGVNVFPTAL
jgi:hypothetical protein